MINKFRYKKPPRDDIKSGPVKCDNSGDCDTLKRNRTKTTKVIDGDLDNARVMDRIVDGNSDFKEENRDGVLDDKTRKQLHVSL